jgi:Ca2+-binding EF-hand superfamily protein
MKNLLILSAISLTVVGSTAAMAMPGKHGGPAARFSALDTNADGKVTKAEFEADKLAKFQHADQNKDGFVTADELISARKAEHGKRIDALFSSSDKNGDGRLSKTEAGDMHERRFAHLDANGDGFVGKDEAKNAAPPDHAKKHGTRWLGKLDTNGDGKISKSEIEQTGGWFDRLDRDGDGVLLASEMKLHRHGSKQRGKGRHEKRQQGKQG